MVLIHVKIRDEVVRSSFQHHLLNLLAERVSSSVYQLDTSDWSESDWSDEFNTFKSMLEGSNERVVIWRFIGTQFSRFTIRG